MGGHDGECRAVEGVEQGVVTEQEKRWRKEFEQRGYRDVRDDMASGGHRRVGGPPEKRRFANAWLKEQKERKSAANQTFQVRSLWIAFVTLLVAIAGVLIAWAAWK
jgi:hypothetical protein